MQAQEETYDRDSNGGDSRQEQEVVLKTDRAGIRVQDAAGDRPKEYLGRVTDERHRTGYCSGQERWYEVFLEEREVHAA